MKIGLLPFYIELYDAALVGRDKRAVMEKFQETIIAEFTRRKVGVVTVPFCRLEKEFKRAVKLFETAEVDAIVTLHIAYSPSLESSKVLAGTKLPIIVLDTTPDSDFSPNQNPDALLFNHGIHGVQDMCNLLIRSGKPFIIEAGHWKKSDVLDRVVAWIPAARAAMAMQTSRIGLIGSPFKGMGDFAVPASDIRKHIGAAVVALSPPVLSKLVAGVTESDIRREMESDRKTFVTGKIGKEAHRKSSVASVVVRRWMEREKLTAFSMNFLAITKASGMPAVPFIAASKAMAAGLGYAGEGDVLTAGLVGSLAKAFGETSFTEMFCPDWKGNSILLSHMGEINPGLVKGGVVLEEFNFPFTDIGNPGRIVGRFKPGKAVFVNLAPLPDNKYRLIVAPITMLDAGKDNMKSMIRGWFRHSAGVAGFLEAYSRLGGTHHAALVYGDRVEAISGFGRFMKWDVSVI